MFRIRISAAALMIAAVSSATAPASAMDERQLIGLGVGLGLNILGNLANRAPSFNAPQKSMPQARKSDGQNDPSARQRKKHAAAEKPEVAALAPLASVPKDRDGNWIVPPPRPSEAEFATYQASGPVAPESGSLLSTDAESNDVETITLGELAGHSSAAASGASDSSPQQGAVSVSAPSNGDEEIVTLGKMAGAPSTASPQPRNECAVVAAPWVSVSPACAR